MSEGGDQQVASRAREEEEEAVVTQQEEEETTETHTNEIDQEYVSAFSNNKHKAPPVVNGDQVATMEDAQEFVDMVKRQQASRDQWQEELVELFRREDEQDKETKKLIREALLNEAEYCGDQAFVRFRAQQEGKYGTTTIGSSLIAADKENIEQSMGGSKMASVAVDQLRLDRQSASTGGGESSKNAEGQTLPSLMTTTTVFKTSHETLRRWFEHDALLALTPFAAVVPVPSSFLLPKSASTTAATAGHTAPTMEQYLVDEIDSVMKPQNSSKDDGEEENEFTMVFEACPLVSGSTKEGHPFAMYKKGESASLCFASGANVVDRIRAMPIQWSALNDTPCLFLNDTPTFEKQRGGNDDTNNQFFGLCFVARGTLIAIELYSDGVATIHQGQTSIQEQEAFEMQYKSFINLMEKHIAETVTPALNCNNYVAGFRGTGSGSAGAGASSCYLLNVASLEPQEYHLFQWRELSELVQQLVGVERRRNVGLAPSASANGGDASTIRSNGMTPSLRMAPLDSSRQTGAASSFSPPSVSTVPNTSSNNSKVVSLSTCGTVQQEDAGSLSETINVLQGEPESRMAGVSPTNEGDDGAATVTTPSPDPTEPATRSKKAKRVPPTTTAPVTASSSGSGLALAFGSAILASVVTGLVVLKLVKRNR